MACCLCIMHASRSAAGQQHLHRALLAGSLARRRCCSCAPSCLHALSSAPCTCDAPLCIACPRQVALCGHFGQRQLCLRRPLPGSRRQVHAPGAGVPAAPRCLRCHLARLHVCAAVRPCAGGGCCMWDPAHSRAKHRPVLRCSITMCRLFRCAPLSGRCSATTWTVSGWAPAALLLPVRCCAATLALLGLPHGSTHPLSGAHDP